MQYGTYLSTHPAYNFDVNEILDKKGKVSGTDLGLKLLREVEQVGLMLKVLNTEKGKILVIYSTQVNSGELNDKGIAVIDESNDQVEESDVNNLEELWENFKNNIEDEDLSNLMEKMNFVPVAYHIYVYEEL